MRPRLFTIIICIVIGLTMISTSVSAAADVSEEYAVKVAFIYNFTKFIDWPAEAFSSSDAPFVFGILGENPFGSSLNFLKDKTVNGHPLIIEYIKDLSVAEKTHILFICESEKNRIHEICSALDTSVLTVGDVDGFFEAGGIINLVTIDNKIRFIINHDAARRSDLNISSHLLQLAIRLR